jgi:hypothetical protein
MAEGARFIGFFGGQIGTRGDERLSGCGSMLPMNA